MIGHTLRVEDVADLDCSLAQPVVPIVEKFRFEPCIGGSLMLDARAALRPGPKVERLTQRARASRRCADEARIEEHLSYEYRAVLPASEAVG